MSKSSLTLKKSLSKYRKTSYDINAPYVFGNYTKLKEASLKMSFTGYISINTELQHEH